MRKLSDLIKGRLDRHHLTTSAQSAEVLFFANQLLGGSFDVENQKVKAYKLDGGSLFISVKGATLSQEVWGKQELILGKLRNRFGEKMVKTIRIKNFN